VSAKAGDWPDIADCTKGHSRIAAAGPAD